MTLWELFFWLAVYDLIGIVFIVAVFLFFVWIQRHEW